MSEQNVSIEVFQAESAALRVVIAHMLASKASDINWNDVIKQANKMVGHHKNVLESIQHIENVIDPFTRASNGM